jgi:hypothetical protein
MGLVINLEQANDFSMDVKSGFRYIALFFGEIVRNIRQRKAEHDEAT